jgi:uncharacterized GH25 family protein
MRRLLAAALLLLAAPAAAHDFWLEPASFRPADSAAIEARFLVGDGGEAEPWDVQWRRIVSLRSFGPIGVVDQQSGVRVSETGVPGLATVRFNGEGTHVLAFESSLSESDISAEEFNEYLEHEGLSPALAARRQAGTTGTRGRETYSRRAKALVQVGTRASDQATRPIGQTLEIVPEINPYAVAGATQMPLRIYFRGQPLAGAQVTLSELGGGAEQTARSDADGRVRFALPAAGRWRAATVWTAPIQHRGRNGTPCSPA